MPTDEDLRDRTFHQIYDAIRGWDIRVHGWESDAFQANSRHVKAILDAVRRGDALRSDFAGDLTQVVRLANGSVMVIPKGWPFWCVQLPREMTHAFADPVNVDQVTVERYVAALRQHATDVERAAAWVHTKAK